MICVITITYQFFAQITPKPGKTHDISVSLPADFQWRQTFSRWFSWKITRQATTEMVLV